LGIVFYTLGQTKIYESMATIQFDPNPPKPLGGRIEQVVELGSGSDWDAQEYYETQYHIIQSMKIALAVVAELGLSHDTAFMQNLPAGVGPAAPPHPVSDESAADVLRSRIRVDPVKNSRLATVRYQDANPERAARIVTAVVDTYISQNLD